jgi:heterodisulfide reductase subunit D
VSSIEAARKYRAYDCIACGHCTYSCPAAHGERRFSPRRFMEEFSQNGGAEGLDIWSCMGCAACTTICPHGVDFHHFMREVRQERKALDPPMRTHAGLVSAIRELDVEGKGTGHHHVWTTPDLELDQGSDVALFVGCVPILDVVFRDFQPGLPDLPRSAVRLLNAMGIKPRLLRDERCCGHDAYWLGDTETFERLAKMNICSMRESVSAPSSPIVQSAIIPSGRCTKSGSAISDSRWCISASYWNGVSGTVS